jgi:hypothetical protein
MTESQGTTHAALEAFAGFASAVLHLAVERATERRGRAFDPVRSLYVADAEAFEILQSGVRAEAIGADAEAPLFAFPDALRTLPRFECRTIAFLAGLAAIPRVDRIVGFLHDDLTRRHVTPALLLDLVANGFDERTRALAALAPDGLLVRLRIVDVSPDEPCATARVSLDAGAFAHLCGATPLDRRLGPYAVRETWNGDAAPATGITPALAQPTILWGADADALATAANACAAAHGLPVLRLAAETPPDAFGIAAREAFLDGALVAVATASPQEALLAARAFAGLPVPTLVEAPAGIANLAGLAHHRVGERARAVEAASVAQPLPYGRRIVARRGVDRLILPPAKVRALRSISARVARRETVTVDWGMETGSSAGGIRCLFAGPPGTGKTLAAEAVAAELGRDLYVVDVSAVVSKYIGETEKILAKVFAEAARARVCLFFDEADALFGKRGEQKDAHDKYANVETAYLLQAIDAYPDLVILATNMRNNLDDALSRRIDVFVDFPMPDGEARRRLWTLALARAPHDPADVERVARTFALSGGGIQGAALAAAYEAAGESRAIALLDLMRAARDELAKSGKVAGRMELGDRYDAVMSEA